MILEQPIQRLFVRACEWVEVHVPPIDSEYIGQEAGDAIGGLKIVSTGFGRSMRE